MFGFDDLRSDLYATGASSSNLLTRAALLDWDDALTRARNVVATCDQGSCKGRRITYDDVAAKRNGIAEVTSVLDYFGNNRSLIEGLTDAQIVDYVNAAGARNAVGHSVLVGDVLGGRTTDSSGRTVAATAFKAVFVLVNRKEEFTGSPVRWTTGNTESTPPHPSPRPTPSLAQNLDPTTYAWEIEFAESTVESRQGGLNLFPFSSAYEESEQAKAINNDIGLLVIGYILLIAYVHFVFSRASWVRSRSNLALWGVFSVLLTIATVLGLVSAIGVDFNLVTQSLFLLLLGLGIDDALVITEAFSDTLPRGGVKSRIASAVARAGVSITVTSLTDVVAFATGLMSSLPALQGACAVWAHS